VRKIYDISLRELLAPSIAHDPDIQAAADAVDSELKKTSGYIPDVAIIKRLRAREIDEPLLLDFLAWGLHVDFYDPELPIEIKQELVAKSLDWHTRKGTPSVVEEIVTKVISDAEVREWFDYGGMPYRFKVGTDTDELSVSMLTTLIDAIFSVKNTRSWMEAIELLKKGLGQFFVGAGIVQNIKTAVPVDYDIGWGEWGWGSVGWGGRPPGKEQGMDFSDFNKQMKAMLFDKLPQTPNAGLYLPPRGFPAWGGEDGVANENYWKIDKAFGKKVTGLYKIYSGIEELGFIAEPSSFDEIISRMQDMSILIHYTNNAPPADLYPAFGVLIVTRITNLRVTMELTSANNSFSTIQKYFSNWRQDATPRFRGWRQYAIALTPGQMSFAFSSQWSASTNICKYWKTQENIVFVVLRAQKTANIIYNDVIATLPVGYRPEATISAPSIYAGGGGNEQEFGNISINSSGLITSYADNKALINSRLIYSLTFFIAA